MKVMKLKLFPSCTQRPRTSSFRMEEHILMTMSSVLFEPEGEPLETPESWFTNSSESPSTTTEPDSSSVESHLEEIIRGAQMSTNQRLFFEPGSETNSITSTESPKQHTPKNVQDLISYRPYSNVYNLIPDSARQKALPFPTPPPQLADESVMMSLESQDPYKDFKRSMEEMVECFGIKHDLEALEEMLGWYLEANDESNHGYVVGSFVDLIAGFLANRRNFDVSKSSSSYSFAPSILSSSASTSQLYDDVSYHI